MAYQNNTVTVDLDLVETSEQLRLNPMGTNKCFGVITNVTLKTDQGQYGPYQKANIKLELDVPVAPGQFEKVTAWFGVYDSKFKKAAPGAYERHIQGFRDRIGHSAEFAFTITRCSGEQVEGAENGAMSITFNLKSLWIPKELIVGGVPEEEAAPAQAQPQQQQTQQQPPAPRPQQPQRTQPTPQVKYRQSVSAVPVAPAAPAAPATPAANNYGEY